ncbi:hypothetical protein GCM10009733_067940 [Nonomuraea maheshkhaliensis]|uniref:Uncharacterized protein n=1 Tax=Nonomuraea maheshkhaliensis TaxID=419590 RepID=A0ABN2FWC8_9ACTN
MNELEERLRAAFDARAQTFEARPDAWARMRERRPWWRLWRLLAVRTLVAALPVALLAVLVPVVLGGGRGGDVAAGADAVHERLMRDRTAAGEEVTVDNPTEDRPLRLWFATAKAGYRELCFVVERAGLDPYGGCSPITDEVITEGWFAGSTLRDGAETAMDWGVALPGVGGVTGVAADGEKFSGTVLRPEGAPYRLWTVTYPARHAMAKIELVDDQGRALGEESRERLTEQQLGAAAGAPLDLPAGVTARPYRPGEGTEVAWTRRGAHLMSAPVKALERNMVIPAMAENVIMGIARADVAKVTYTFPDGASNDFVTQPDPWGLGVALFAGENPAGSWREGSEVVAFDAGGAVLWRQADREDAVSDAIPATGAVMTLPGGLRTWFSGTSTICLSGDASPEGGVKCQGGARYAGPHPLKAITYLPAPGSSTHVGVADESWESVRAVLSDGRRLDAAFQRGKGTPARIWHVTIPNGDAVLVGFTVRTENGRVDRYPETNPSCGRKAVGTETGRQSLPAGMTAVVAEPSCLAFFEQGKPSPSLPGPLPGEKLSDLLTAERPVRWSYGATAWYGYGPAGTARVELRTSNGLTVTMDAVPDQSDQGVTLFAAPIPKGAEFSAGMSITGYDAAGGKLWQDGPRTPATPRSTPS